MKIHYVYQFLFSTLNLDVSRILFRFFMGQGESVTVWVIILK